MMVGTLDSLTRRDMRHLAASSHEKLTSLRNRSSFGPWDHLDCAPREGYRSL